MQNAIFFLLFASLSSFAFAGQVGDQQSAQSASEAKKAEVADALTRLKAGESTPTTMEILVEAGAVEVIPLLEEQFALSKNLRDKAKIAETLVKLHDQDVSYWNYLEELVSATLSIDDPSVDLDPTQLHNSQALFTFVAKHHVPPSEVEEQMANLGVGGVALMGATGDPRGVPLLRRALSYPGEGIQIIAAYGLAQIHDEASVPFILAACKKAPADTAAVMAEALVYFDDPEAQKGVDLYLSKEDANIFRLGRKNGSKPL